MKAENIKQSSAFNEPEKGSSPTLEVMSGSLSLLVQFKESDDSKATFKLIREWVALCVERHEVRNSSVSTLRSREIPTRSLFIRRNEHTGKPVVRLFTLAD